MAVIYDGQGQGGIVILISERHTDLQCSGFRGRAKYIGSIIGVLRAWAATGGGGILILMPSSVTKSLGIFGWL